MENTHAGWRGEGRKKRGSKGVERVGRGGRRRREEWKRGKAKERSEVNMERKIERKEEKKTS